MIEMSSEDAQTAIGMVAEADQQRVALLMSAVMSLIESAMEGECAGCSCDVCVSLRGTLLGVTMSL